jgi:hypothetical protein
MVSKFSNIMININKIIDNRNTFFSGGVTLCTRNVKYFCHLSVYLKVSTLICWKYQYNKYTLYMFNFIDHLHCYFCEWLCR